MKPYTKEQQVGIKRAGRKFKRGLGYEVKSERGATITIESERLVDYKCPPDCPFPQQAAWHDEWLERCRSAAPHGHRDDQMTHAHWPKKQMGGNNPKAKVRAYICWPIHDSADNGLFGMGVAAGEFRIWDPRNVTVLRGPDGASSDGGDASLRGVAPQAEVSEPPPSPPSPGASFIEDVALDAGRVAGIVPLPKGGPAAVTPPSTSFDEDWSHLSDEELTVLFQAAHETQQRGFLAKCKAVCTYHDKHEQQWGEKWVEGAYGVFQESRRVLPYYARIWQIVRAAQSIYAEQAGQIDKGLLRTFGRMKVERGLLALEVLTAHVADFGEVPTPSDLLKRLAGETELEVKEKHACPDCGKVHTP